MNEVILDHSTHQIIAAPMERVFNTLTSLQGLRSWWKKRVTGEPAEKGILCFGNNRVNEYLIMHVDAAQCGSLVQWTIVKDTTNACWQGTRIRFELENIGNDMCVLYFRHSGLNPELPTNGHIATWESALENIARESAQAVM